MNGDITVQLFASRGHYDGPQAAGWEYIVVLVVLFSEIDPKMHNLSIFMLSLLIEVTQP